MGSSSATENWLTCRARQTPGTAALVYDGGSLTYAELEDQALLRARILMAALPQGGDGEPRVALLAANCVEYVLWVLGALEARVQFVPLNIRLSLTELQAQVEDSAPFMLLCDEARLETARTLEASCPSRPKALCFADALALPASCAPGADALANTPFELARVSNIMYTSGSTGRPKGVLQTLENHWHSAHNCRDNLGFSVGRDVWGCPTPLFHTSGLSIVMRSLACGVGVRLYDRFDAAAVNDDVLEGRVTCLSAVTQQIERMLDELEARTEALNYPKSLRFVLQGGGPLPAETLRRCRNARMGVVQSFGMTETASQVVALSPADAPLKEGSSGRPLGGVELRIAPQGDPHASEALPPGTTGRILIKSPTLAPGYLNQEARYRASFTQDGWFDTGDLGHCDADGYLYVACRRSDLIISGGENVYPAEVEAAVMQHPAVADVIVAGVPDPVWGTVPAALCVPAFPATPNGPSLPNADELRTFCRTHLAAYKCPRHVVWTTGLPYTASGKPQRAKAAELLESALEKPPAL